MDTEKIICFDSDGCVMDTMEVKHHHCFGPCFIREWELDTWREPLLKRWNEINLYESTRGINRFKGLALILREVDKSYTPVPGLRALEQWTQTGSELSESALKDALEKLPEGENRACLAKALAWSRATNAAIEALPEEEKAAFPGAREGLAAAAAYAMVAVVSSANRDAVEAEWSRCGLLEYVDVVMAQDNGSKAECLRRLSERVAPENILMVGDAPGDRAAAEKNGVWFYPILARREAESWQRFPENAEAFLQGKYAQRQPELLAEFTANLTQV